tara:strand:- start:1343 stop:1618 length:276 start_codon:yes stop_codon:yes gene_type:complete
MKPTKCSKNILKNNFKWADIEKLNTISLNGFDVGLQFENGHWASIIINDIYNVHSYEILSSITQKTSAYIKTFQSKKQVMSHLKYLSKLTK